MGPQHHQFDKLLSGQDASVVIPVHHKRTNNVTILSYLYAEGTSQFLPAHSRHSFYVLSCHPLKVRKQLFFYGFVHSLQAPCFAFKS